MGWVNGLGFPWMNLTMPSSHERRSQVLMGSFCHLYRLVDDDDWTLEMHHLQDMLTILELMTHWDSETSSLSTNPLFNDVIPSSFACLFILTSSISLHLIFQHGRLLNGFLPFLPPKIHDVIPCLVIPVKMTCMHYTTPNQKNDS